MSTSGNLIGNVFDSSLQADADGKVTIDGDLTVEGTTTSIETVNLKVEDKLIELASGTTGTPSGDAGIIVERGSSANASVIWDETADTWVMSTTSATGSSTGDLTLTDAALKAAAITASGNVSAPGLLVDSDVTATTNHTTVAATIDYDATGIIASGQTGNNVGLDLDINSNSPTMVGTVNNTGLDIDLTGGTSGTQTNIGIDVNVTGADTNYAAVLNGGNVGIGTSAPLVPFHVAGAAPYQALQNTAAENGEGECESRILFADHTGTALAQIEGSHSGTADDTKGKLNLFTHNGSALTAALTIDDTQKATFTSTSTNSIVIDQNFSVTDASSTVGLDIDFDKTGASTSDNTMIGLNVDMDNTTATNGTNTMVGAMLTPTLQHASAAGTTLVKGAEIIATGSGPGNTTTRALDLTATGADFNQGIFMKIDNGGPDIKMLSSADNADFCTISTGANGEVTIATTDGGAAAGHINLDPDGDVIIKGATPKLIIGDAGAEDTMLVFDGNAEDFRIGIDDGTDTLEIGKGSAHGTDAIIKIAASTNLTMLLNSAVADGEYSGNVALFQAGEDLTAGEVVYFKSDGKVHKAVATAAATSRCTAMCVATVSANAMGPFLLEGFARFDSEFPTWTVGGALFTPEAETSSKNVPEQTAPDTDGDFVQVIGYAVSTDAVYFKPDSTVIEVA